MRKPVLITYLLFLCACSSNPKASNEKEQKPPHTFFQLLEADQTGIDFQNRVEDQADFNVLTYRNFYNGGGVAVGDINNDGLADLYFTANLGKNKLYLNKGDFIFEDITEQAGVAGTKAWSTGVSMADVNHDGWLDIYVSNSGDISGDNKENELFINQGNLKFKEEAATYGLNNKGYSTQAAFFDYDLDGDLDCYLLNNSFRDPAKIELYRSMRDTPDPLGGDKLYRNDGKIFTDVTHEAGIYSSAIGFGLGNAIGDVNGDHYPDIYVSNDFWERDYLYINQQDGTFSEELIDRINFSSISSMGGDMADLNNDGNPEIISTDMLAGDNYRLKAMTAFDPFHLEDMKYRANYHYQIGQNCLHVNDGKGNFAEVAMQAQVAATDWSWGALIFDFENDGLKDLFISNGIQKELMDQDFRDFLANNDVYRKIAQNQEMDIPAMIQRMPSYPLKNYAFSNQGKMKFMDRAGLFGLGTPSFSNGAAYADLDNDGDMDLVVNNVNAPAFVYKNETEKLGNHYLKLVFKGSEKNPFGVGTTVRIRTGETIQVWQNFASRGFQSSIEPKLIFGLGKVQKIDSIAVTWPDLKQQLLTDVSSDQTLTINYTEAAETTKQSASSSEPLFVDRTQQLIQGDSRHRENTYNDFDHEILLHKMLSTEGPRIIKGDVNNDKRDDFIVLGAKDDADKLFIQHIDGSFRRKANQSFHISKGFESTCGTFFDYDNDGDQDLILGAGGNDTQIDRKFYIPRYFENDGRGNFRVDNTYVPQIVGNFSVITAADFDQDGDEDLFFGGRCVPGNYGLPPRSYLMLNEQGKWLDISPDALAGIGMVTDATWSDIDNDNDKDLVIVGEWMGIHIFRNEAGQLLSNGTIPNSNGWWNRIQPKDLDKDGDIDFVIGNWGNNSKFQASSNEPLRLFVNDFDQNGKSEFILDWYPPLDDQSYPFATKPELTQQLPHLRKTNLKYETFAQQTYTTLFPPEIRQTAISYSVTNLSSAILWNEGSSFSLQALPREAQVSPIFAIIAEDLTGNGHIDIWVGGNFYGLKPQVGRQDASRGMLLEGNGGRTFHPAGPNVRVPGIIGEVRDARSFLQNDKKVLIISRNNSPLVALQQSN